MDNSIKKHLPDLIENEIKFKVIGDISHLSPDLRGTISHAELATSNFKKYKLNIAYNYGGQWDILNSINTFIGKKCEISYDNISSHLSTGNDFQI